MSEKEKIKILQEEEWPEILKSLGDIFHPEDIAKIPGQFKKLQTKPEPSADTREEQKTETVDLKKELEAIRQEIAALKKVKTEIQGNTQAVGDTAKDRIAKRKEEILKSRQAKSGEDEFTKICDGLKVPKSNRELLRPHVLNLTGKKLQENLATLIKKFPIISRSTTPSQSVISGSAPNVTKKMPRDMAREEKIEELQRRLSAAL